MHLDQLGKCVKSIRFKHTSIYVQTKSLIKFGLNGQKPFNIKRKFK